MEEKLVAKILFCFLIVLQTFFLNTCKIVHIFHMKANNVGNASNQRFLVFLCCFFFKEFFHSGMKSCDCLGEESNVEKRNKTVHWLSALVESYLKFLSFGNIR